MQCNACRSAISDSDYLKCKSCSNLYHCECLNIRKVQLKKIKAELSVSWECPQCINSTRHKLISPSTPVRDNQLLFDDPTSPSDISAVGLMASTSMSGSSEVTMENISKLLDEKLNASFLILAEQFKQTLMGEVKSIVRNEIDSIVDKVKNDFTATTDFFAADISELKTEITNKMKEIRNLEKENDKLRETLANVNKRLASLELSSRSANLEIQLVPENPNENVVELFRKLCDVIQVPITNGDIRACRRVAKLNKNNDRPRNILVSLSSSLLRDTILSATHRFNKSHPQETISADHLGLKGGKIYVAEHLSPEMKNLHSSTRRVCKEKGYRYVWIKYGRLFVRLNDNSRAICIDSADSLSKL